MATDGQTDGGQPSSSESHWLDAAGDDPDGARKSWIKRRGAAFLACGLMSAVAFMGMVAIGESYLSAGFLTVVGVFIAWVLGRSFGVIPEDFGPDAHGDDWSGGSGGDGGGGD